MKYEHTLPEPLITFETAKLARNAGFKLKTLWNFDSVNADLADEEDNWNQYEDMYSAPTQALLQKWLREKHELNVHTYSAHAEKNYKWGVSVYDLSQGRNNDADKYEVYASLDLSTLWDAYEAAIEKGLQEALTRLSSNKNTN